MNQAASMQHPDLTYGRAPRRLDPETAIAQHRDMVRRIAWHVYGGLSSRIELEDLVAADGCAVVPASVVSTSDARVELDRDVVMFEGTESSWLYMLHLFFGHIGYRLL